MSNLQDFVSATFDKVRGMVDVNTIIGEPITSPDGTILIPVTKVSIGVASGGMDAQTADKSNQIRFNGGSGSGVSITPVAFIVLSGGNSKVIYVNQSSNVSTLDRLVDMVPETIDKIAGFIKTPEKAQEI